MTSSQVSLVRQDPRQRRRLAAYPASTRARRRPSRASASARRATRSAPPPTGADPSPPRAPRASAGTGSTDPSSDTRSPDAPIDALAEIPAGVGRRAARRRPQADAGASRCRPGRPRDQQRQQRRAEPPPPRMNRFAMRGPAVSPLRRGDAGNQRKRHGARLHERAVLQHRIRRSAGGAVPALTHLLHRQQQRPHRPHVLDGDCPAVVRC